jgi:hypothetical protein
MEKIKYVTYGLGGYDESKPHNNLVETIYYTEAESAQLAQEEAEAEAKAAARAAILDRLGITADEAALLLG